MNDLTEKIAKANSQLSTADKQIGALMFQNNLLKLVYESTLFEANKATFNRFISQAEEITNKEIGYKAPEKQPLTGAKMEHDVNV